MSEGGFELPKPSRKLSSSLKIRSIWSTSPRVCVIIGMVYLEPNPAISSHTVCNRIWRTS